MQVDCGPVSKGEGTTCCGRRDGVWLVGVTRNTCRCQGVFIPNFARLGWEIKPTLAGDNRQVPFFEVTDHFCRSHGLPVVRKPKPMHRAHMDEINFIKLSIKYDWVS